MCAEKKADTQAVSIRARGGWTWQKHCWPSDDKYYRNYIATWTETRDRTHTSRDGMWLWVVEYRATPRKYYVVDGSKSGCGAEPILAGPFKRVGDAQDVVAMLTETRTIS